MIDPNDVPDSQCPLLDFAGCVCTHASLANIGDANDPVLQRTTSHPWRRIHASPPTLVEGYVVSDPHGHNGMAGANRMSSTQRPRACQTRPEHISLPSDDRRYGLRSASE
jgi:hypothetical protein